MQRMMWICGLVLVFVFSWSLAFAEFYVVPSQKGNYAPVQKSGQTTCYGSGTTTPCDGTGQDGDLQKGVAWPNPRFTDNGDGTIKDNLTGLIWLKDANCFGSRSWIVAQGDCNGLASGSCDLIDGSSTGDWRLPNLFELESLRHMGYYNPCISDTAGTGQWSEGDPFTNIQNSAYWSSNTSVSSIGNAFSVYMTNGHSYTNSKGGKLYVWPVKGGID